MSPLPPLAATPLRTTDSVTYTATCDRCPADATWLAVRVETGSSSDQNRVDLTVECARCDRPWSLTQQIARRLELIRNAVIERTAA